MIQHCMQRGALLTAYNKGKALDDAKTYKDMQPDLSKSCYAQGAALILVKVSCASQFQ
jgi:hypothetical protein